MTNDTMTRRAASHETATPFRARGRQRGWPAAALPATLLMAALLLVFIASPSLNTAGAQSHVVISNTSQTSDSTAQTLQASGANVSAVAQRFSTGIGNNGYTLDSIGIKFAAISAPSTAGDDIQVTVQRLSGTDPGDNVCTLDDPGSFTANAVNTFTAPTGDGRCPSLTKDTDYFVVVERVMVSSSSTISAATTTSDAHDQGLSSDWLIANSSHSYSSSAWASDASYNFQIEISADDAPPPGTVDGFELDSAHNDPKGIWGNETTFWIANDAYSPNNKLYAYSRADGSRDSASDFNTLDPAANDQPQGICSDGTTMFVADSADNQVYAYKMSDKSRDSAKDITLATANSNAKGVWCDDSHVWVAQDDDGFTSKIFVYQRSDGSHASSMDISAATMNPSTSDSTINNSDPRGLWSNGTTLYAVDDEDHKIYGYKLADRTRDDDKNLALEGNNGDPEGIWFDGRIMWVVDDVDDRVYPYLLPEAQLGNNLATGSPSIRSPTTDRIWAETLTVGTDPSNNLGYLTTGSNTGSLTGTTFILNNVTFTIKDIYLTNYGTLGLVLSEKIPRDFTLTLGSNEFFSAGLGDDFGDDAFGYFWHDSGFSWASSDSVAASLNLEAIPKVGDVLVADPQGIFDDTDGVVNTSFHYQWISSRQGESTLIDGATGPMYTVPPEDAHSHLELRAIFEDNAGYQDGPLFSRQVGPVEPIVPDPPRSLTAEAAPDATPQVAVALSWTAPFRDWGGTLTKHQYRYRTGMGPMGQWTDVPDSERGEANATSYTAASLPTANPPITFGFEVRAVNANGGGPESNTASATIDVPDQIASFQVEEDDRQFELSWTTPDNNGSAILRYEYSVVRVQGSLVVISQGTTIPGSDADTTSVTVTGLTNGSIYTAEVRAVNSVGGAMYHVEQGIVPATFPSEPKDLTGEAGNMQALLRWAQPDSHGGGGIDVYQYQQKEGSNAYSLWTDIVGSTALTTEHTVTGLTNGTTYSFKVRAKNRKGGSPASNEVTVVPANVPTAPQNLTATAGNGRVRLDWTTPTSDGGNPITHYELRLKAGNLLVPTWATVPNSDVNTTAHSVTGLHNGTTYIFELRAATATLKGETASVTATPMTETPDTPAVTLGPQGSGLQVSWTIADDGGAPVTEYHVQWKSGSQSFDSSREQTGLTGSSTTITGLTNGTSYDVRVRAMNSAGWSGWSATRSETPRPRPIPTVAITASVSEPVTGPFRVTFTFTDTNNAGDQHYGIEGFEASDIAAWYTSPGTESYEFEVEDFREEAAGRVYSALVDEIIDGKLWIDVPDGAAQSSYDGLKVIGAYETWQVDAPDPPPAPEGAQVWEDTLTIGGKEGDWDAGIMGYFIGWSPNTDKDKRFGALPNANFTYAGVDYEVLELSYTPSWRVVRLAMCPLLDGANRRFELRLDDDYVSFDPDDYQKRDFGRTKDGSRQQCREYDWGKITLDWTYGHTKNVRITR